MSFTLLTNKNEHELIALRRNAQQLFSTHFFDRPRSDEGDLQMLQLVYDLNLVSKFSPYDMLALGVVYGDVFRTAIPELKWVISSEIVDSAALQQYCLQYKDSSLAVYPIETYVVPFEVGDEINVQQTFDEKIGMMRFVIEQNISLAFHA